MEDYRDAMPDDENDERSGDESCSEDVDVDVEEDVELIQQNVARLLQMCNLLCAQLARSAGDSHAASGADDAAEDAEELIARYFGALDEIQQAFRRQLANYRAPVPFNRTSYAERKALDIAVQKSAIIAGLAAELASGLDEHRTS